MCQFSDGVWLVDLASVVDPPLVAQATAETLGLCDRAGRDPEDVLAEYLSERSALLILDNCEHLLEACAVSYRQQRRLRRLSLARQRYPMSWVVSAWVNNAAARALRLGAH